MRTTARLDGEEYVLNGSKRFITNAGVAQLYTVFAKTDPSAGHSGISAFLVEADASGFEVTRLESKMGIKGSTTGELVFEECRVPAANLLGEEGDGFKIAMRILDRSRPGVAAQGLGLAQGATDFAVEYATAALQVAAQSFAQTWKRFERISITGNQPYTVAVRIKQCPESVPFNFKKPVRVGKRSPGA